MCSNGAAIPSIVSNRKSGDIKTYKPKDPVSDKNLIGSRSTPTALHRGIYRKEPPWKPWDVHGLPKCPWNWKPPLPTFSFRQVCVEGSCWEVTSSPVCTHWWLPRWCISLHWSIPRWSQDRVWVFAPLPTAVLLLKLFMPNTVTIVSLEYRIM